MPRSLLVVDDQKDIADMLSEFLAEAGYRVRAVADGSRMRAALEAERFDAVILDLTFPGGQSGWTLADAVRSHGAALIVMTGDHRHAVELEAKGWVHIMKPFRLAAMVGLLEQALGGTAEAAE
jgi:two-component system, OmpR family, response regulator